MSKTVKRYPDKLWLLNIGKVGEGFEIYRYNPNDILDEPTKAYILEDKIQALLEKYEKDMEYYADELIIDLQNLIDKARREGMGMLTHTNKEDKK